MPIDRTERTFETDIETYLLEHGGYGKGQAQSFDPEDALDKETLLQFIKTSQPRQWERLVSIHGADAEQNFLQRVKQDINKRGILEVIRKEVKDYGVTFKLAFFAPANELNPDTKTLYDQNILTITRQVRYSTRNNNSIDVLLSLNGLPLVTMELKNPATGQTAQHAVNQYKNDRDPKELLFQFKKRALVHFALDANVVFMTTRLAGSKTFFLPFNKGNNNGAGNPINKGGVPYRLFMGRDSDQRFFYGYSGPVYSPGAEEGQARGHLCHQGKHYLSPVPPARCGARAGAGCQD